MLRTNFRSLTVCYVNIWLLYILFIILFCDLLFSEKPAGNILKTFQDKQERHFPTFLYTEFTITDETDDNFLTILDAKLFI